MGCAQDGASTTVQTATSTRVAELGVGGLELATPGSPNEVPGLTVAAPRPPAGASRLGASATAPGPPSEVPRTTAKVPGPAAEVPWPAAKVPEPDPTAPGSADTKMESDSGEGLIDVLRKHSRETPLVWLAGWSQCGRGRPPHCCQLVVREGTRTHESARSSGHIGVLGVLVARRLLDHQVGVGVVENAADADFFGQSEPKDECLVLGYIIGGGEVDLQRVLQLVAFGRGEDDAGSQAGGPLSAIKVHPPMHRIPRWWQVLGVGPVDEEVGQRLGLNGGAGLVEHGVGG